MAWTTSRSLSTATTRWPRPWSVFTTFEPKAPSPMTAKNPIGLAYHHRLLGVLEPAPRGARQAERDRERSHAAQVHHEGDGELPGVREAGGGAPPEPPPPRGA